MSNEVIIAVENLGKRYRIAHKQANGRRYKTLRDVLADKVRRMFRNSPSAAGNSPTVEDFWALKNVSFEIKRGEVVGFIGRNGAGKSTLLKILSRITEPTEGRIRIRGRVASLLEVGTGFHPELTGRENIFLNGAILGMQRAEIKQKFDEIVAFAEMERFLDTPVKRYSSGMYVRLAFAVAAHLEPEILVVDEVLAVGDAEFQKKCLGKMQSVAAQEGRTVLFVSHNMAAMQALCTRAVYLHSGTVRRAGAVDALVADYMQDAKAPVDALSSGPLALGDGLELQVLELYPNSLISGDALRFRLELRARAKARISELAMLVYSQTGVRLAVLDFRGCGVPKTFADGESWELAGEIASMPLVEGDYSVGLYVSMGGAGNNFLDLAGLTIVPRLDIGARPTYPAAHRGMIELKFRLNANEPDCFENPIAIQG
jgi:lipopolysaccharide transport system ATP-binding protein